MRQKINVEPWPRRGAPSRALLGLGFSLLSLGLSIVGGAGLAELVNFLDCRHSGHYKLLHWPLVLETVDFIGL